MGTYRPLEGVFVGRPPCAECGAAYRLHIQPGGIPTAALACPQAYRPGTLEEARRMLDEAIASGDQARVFVMRGEVQRLEGQR